MKLPTPASLHRIVDFAIPSLIVLLALTVSPIGICIMTGRVDLTPRIMVLSLTFAAFLLVLAAAVPSRGRIKVVMFYLLMLSFPLVLLAGVEAAAIVLHLADRIAPLEDMSTLANRNGWPAHFMSAARKVEKDGLQLYRPWEGQEIIINELGLRTALPTAKRSGEWRIAITGGSVAFGWRMPSGWICRTDRRHQRIRIAESRGATERLARIIGFAAKAGQRAVAHRRPPQLTPGWLDFR
jgi:hypothetical protein